MYLYKHLSINNATMVPYPFNRELAMEAFLIENESVLSLEKAGYEEVSILNSEIHLVGAGKNGKNGRIDILCKYGTDTFAVVELKLGELKNAHLNQLLKYLKKKEGLIRNITKNNEYIDKEDPEPKWIGILVGEKISNDLLSELVINEYKINLSNTDDATSNNDKISIVVLLLNRFRGEDKNIYIVTDTLCNIDNLKKDNTKYMFNNHNYGKGRLVLAVIKDYVKDNLNITFAGLLKEFPHDLQGKEIFCTLDEANNKTEDGKRKRNFIDSDDIITLQGGTQIAVSNQWGIGNINDFITKYNETELNLNIIEEAQNENTVKSSRQTKAI